MSNNEYLVQFDTDKQILFVVIISILLLFEKTKFIIKKITLTNFFSLMCAHKNMIITLELLETYKHLF